MVHQIKVSCCKDNLKSIRDFVSGVLDSYNIPETDINLVVVAIDEVCSNLMIHSHNCDASEAIEVKVFYKNGTFVFEIIDREEIFDIVDYEAPTIEKIISEKSTGGIGLILVKKIMDNIQIEKQKGFNICRLYKTLAP